MKYAISLQQKKVHATANIRAFACDMLPMHKRVGKSDHFFYNYKLGRIFFFGVMMDLHG